MTPRIGIDITSVERVRRQLAHPEFRTRVFCDDEQSDDPEKSAGIFAIKEAVVKALDLGPGRWREIHVTHTQTGRPSVTVENVPTSIDVSLSHEGDTVIAVALVMVNDQ